jgi:hypothetical protein
MKLSNNINKGLHAFSKKLSSIIIAGSIVGFAYNVDFINVANQVAQKLHYTYKNSYIVEAFKNIYDNSYLGNGKDIKVKIVPEYIKNNNKSIIDNDLKIG